MKDKVSNKSETNLHLILEYIKIELLEILPQIKEASLKAKNKYSSDPVKLKSSLKKLQKTIDSVKFEVIKDKQDNSNKFESIKAFQKSIKSLSSSQPAHLQCILAH